MAFGPFVSMELAQWNPLRKFVPIGDFQWYQALFDFGFVVNPTSKEVQVGEMELVC